MQALGIEPIGLLAQVVNFIIIFWLLKKFLYGPVMKIIQQRQEKISQSMENVEQIEKRLAKLEEQVHNKLKQTHKQAEEIIQEAQKSGNQIQKNAQNKAEEQAKKIIAKADESIKIKEKQLINQIESKITDLAVAMTAKIIQGLDSDTKISITKNSIKQIGKTLN
jgi:F-type H+-transporting ATPase subunit b